MIKTRIPVVYLAGGTRSNWQDAVIAAVKERFGNAVIFMDPRTHGLQDEHAYTAWDLHAVAMSNVVFAYMEPENPGGHGLALEIGFAAGMQHAGAPAKRIVLVSPLEHKFHRYLGMARACSHEVAFDLDQGIEVLIEVLRDVQAG